MNLPFPDDLTSLVVRTDFSSDDAWEAVKGLLSASADHANATYVDDPAYQDATVEALIEAAGAGAGSAEPVTYVLLADQVTMANQERELLAVDLWNEPGRTFRLPLSLYAEVSDNLSMANMDFADFADAADIRGQGSYRGFE